jgi:hypothetical protein
MVPRELGIEAVEGDLGGTGLKDCWYRRYRKVWLVLGLVLGLPACFIMVPFVWGSDLQHVLFSVAACAYLILGSLLIVLFGLASRHSWLRIAMLTYLFVVIASVILAWTGSVIRGGGAIDRGRQKRTMSDIRGIGAAVDAYTADHGFCPQVSSIDELKTSLEPRYIKHLPRQDSWHQEFGYAASRKERKRYVIVCYGIRGEPDVSDISEYLDGDAKRLFGPTDNWKNDIVYVDGQFEKWPEGSQHR